MFDLDVPVELQGDNIHRLENILTLSAEYHINFDNLHLWLKPKPVCSHLCLPLSRAEK